MTIYCKPNEIVLTAFDCDFLPAVLNFSPGDLLFRDRELRIPAAEMEITASEMMCL